MDITKTLAKNKSELLKYFRDRSNEFVSEVNDEFGNTEFKKKAKKINTLLVKARVTIIEIIDQKGKRENWTNKEILESVLMVTYCNYVVTVSYTHLTLPTTPYV